jgi:hypothetical protein
MHLVAEAASPLQVVWVRVFRRLTDGISTPGTMWRKVERIQVLVVAVEGRKDGLMEIIEGLVALRAAMRRQMLLRPCRATLN